MATSTAPLNAVTGRLTGWIDRMRAKLEDEAPPAVPATPACDPEVAGRLEAFRKDVANAQEILDHVGPRLLLLLTVVEVLQLPGPPPPSTIIRLQMPLSAEAHGVPAAQREWLLPLATMLLQHRQPARDVLVALEQWRQARACLTAARARLAGLEAMPCTELPGALAGTDPRDLRAAVFPLLNLALTFRRVPLLGDLFPPSPAPVAPGARPSARPRSVSAKLA